MKVNVKARRAVVVSIALATLVIVAALVALTSSNHRSVARLSAAEMGCAAEALTVTTLDYSPLSERYRVTGCARAAEVVCLAPDFICLVRLER